MLIIQSSIIIYLISLGEIFFGLCGTFHQILYIDIEGSKINKSSSDVHFYFSVLSDMYISSCLGCANVHGNLCIVTQSNFHKHKQCV